MNLNNKKYLSKLFKFSEAVNGIEMSFEDRSIEETYLKSNWQSEKTKLKLFLIFITIFYAFALFLNLIIVDFHPNRNTFMPICGLIVELILFALSNVNEINLKFFSVLKNIRFICMYLFVGFIIMFQINKPNPDSCFMSRVLLGFIFFTNFLYLFYIEYNVLIFIIFMVIIFIFLIFMIFVTLK